MGYETDGRERLLRGHSGRVFLLLTFGLIAMKLTQRLLPPLVPAIIDDLAITPFAAGVALSVFRFARASMQYPSGRFADRLSRTTVLLPSLGIGVASLLILSVSPTYAVFLVGLALFGAGLGLYPPASRALLSDLFDEKRGRAFGLNMMGGDMAGILAAGLAIRIVSVATWRHAFLPVLVAVLPLPFLLYRLSREPVSVSSVDLGLRETGSRLFGDPRMRWLVVAYSLFVLASSGVISFLPTFLVEVHGFSFAFASSAFALLYAVGMVAKPAAGTVSDRLPRSIVAGGGLALAGGGLAVLVGAPPGIAALAGVVLYAAGQRAVPPPLQAHLMDQYPDDSMAGDFGATRMTYMVIGSSGPAYTGFVAGRFGYVPAYASIIVFFLLAGAILFWLSVSGRAA